MHRDDPAAEAFDRGFAAGQKLLLPLCPYPRSAALLGDAWRQGVAAAQQQCLRAVNAQPHPERAALLVANAAIS